MLDVLPDRHIVLGIDPGKRGGIVALYDDQIQDLTPMPTDASLVATYIQLLNPHHVFIERGQAFPGQGIASAYTYGRHNGELIGVCRALKVPFTLISPNRWTAYVHMGIEGDDSKKKSLQAFRNLFPRVEAVLPGCKKPHDGCVDAALIALYGVRQVLTKQVA